MSEPLLKVQNLKKYFPVVKGLLISKTVGWIKAVDDISFDINQGETFALVGESGCGKTTTARVILLLLRPTSGTLWFQGSNIFEFRGDHLKQYRRSVQSIFQDPFSSLNARMRVRNIISEPLLMNDTMSPEERSQRVEELLSEVSLPRVAANLYPHEFSGGQRQRIALARAISLNPKMVVLDEPVSALDVSIRAQIMNLLRDIQERSGISYLLIAHNLATVRYMSHNVGVMYLGRIVELAPTETLYTNALHPYTQALLSAALPSSPDRPREELILTGEVPSPINIPPGCRFHPRCFKAQEVCSEQEPPFIEVETGHWAACHLR
ncbi:ABC transporter ATP-binding protein [Chloroflexota bacterium]